MIIVLLKKREPLMQNERKWHRTDRAGKIFRGGTIAKTHQLEKMTEVPGDLEKKTTDAVLGIQRNREVERRHPRTWREYQKHSLSWGGKNEAQSKDQASARTSHLASKE